MKRLLILSSALSLLGGCQNLHKAPDELLSSTLSNQWLDRLACPVPTEWYITGKGSVQHEGQAHSFQYTWQQQDASHFKILLNGPMGAHRTELIGNEQIVVLSLPDGQQLTAQGSDYFIDDLFGIDVPMAQLSLWLFGMPDLSVPYQASVDRYGRPHQLIQNGWSIAYRYQETEESICQPPYRIDIANQLTKLRLVIK